MKILSIAIIIFLSFSSAALSDSNDLYVLIRKLDSKTLVKDYLVKNGELKVIYGVSEIAQEKFFRKLTPWELSDLTKLLEHSHLSDLKESYINHEVEDGYYIIYTIIVDGNEVHSRTVNVYQPTLISICEKVNALLPEKYRIRIPIKSENGIIYIE